MISKGASSTPQQAFFFVIDRISAFAGGNGKGKVHSHFWCMKIKTRSKEAATFRTVSAALLTISIDGDPATMATQGLEPNQVIEEKTRAGTRSGFGSWKIFPDQC